jgi:hypothetical protein
MSDMLKRQMQALESIMYSDDDTATSTTEGLMGQGMSDSEPEDYVTSFVKYLRSKRDLDPAKAREEIPAVKARNTSITDEDIAKYEEEMSVFEQAKQSAMEARLQREASGITQSLTEEDVMKGSYLMKSLFTQWLKRLIPVLLILIPSTLMEVQPPVGKG